MDRKKEMIKELTNTAQSVLKEYYDAYKADSLQLEEVQLKAAQEIGRMRYGKEQKDYFWIISSEPEMVMHPYRKDLIGNRITSYNVCYTKLLRNQSLFFHHGLFLQSDSLYAP